MKLMDKIRKLAGVKPKFIKILNIYDKVLNLSDEVLNISDKLKNRKCSCINCSNYINTYCIVNECDEEGNIKDKNNYLLPFCTHHSSINSVYEIKYKAELIEVKKE